MKRAETFLPIFTGFYYSYYIDEIENRINLDIEDGYLSEDFEYSIDFNKYATLITEGVNQLLFNHYGFEVELQELIQPKFYNYSNDSINVVLKYDSDKFNKLIEENKTELAEMIKDRCTSCDGFYSSHSNDIKDWLNNYEDDAHKIGALLDMICEIDEIDEFEILEYINSNYDLYDIIID